MSKKPSKVKTLKRKATDGRRKPVGQKRKRAIFNRKDGTVVYPAHAAGEGYNVPMIRDFNEQLLMELRCAQAISVQKLRMLKDGKSLAAAGRVVDCPSDAENEQFFEYFDKYKSMLVFPEEFDQSGVIPDEANVAKRLWHEEDIRRREEQIGHLEALQDLIEEALQCAKVNYGVKPTKKVQLLEFLPKPIEVPAFETLQGSYEEEYLGSDESIEAIKTCDAMIALIVPEGQPSSQPDGEVFIYPTGQYCKVKGGQANFLPDGQAFSVFGREHILKAISWPNKFPFKACPVRNRDELQFLLSALVKYRGRHDFSGDLDSPFEV